MNNPPGHSHDPETGPAQERFALIYVPRRQRNRFPANCVQLCDSEASARTGADEARHLYAALVVGPSKSSEGLEMYYLVRWLS